MLRHELYSPAIVQTVRQFDEHDPHIVVEREQNTFEILGLKTLGLYVGHLGSVLIVEHGLDFGQTVHQGCNLGSEQGTYVIHGVFSVFHHVVQQGGSHGFVTETDFLNYNLGYGYRMEYIWFTRTPADILMRLICKFIGFFDNSELLVVAASFFGKTGKLLPGLVNDIEILLGKFSIFHTLHLSIKTESAPRQSHCQFCCLQEACSKIPLRRLS